MKRACSLLAVWALAGAVAGAQDPARKAPSPPYTMATYQLVLLKPGPEAPRLGDTSEGQQGRAGARPVACTSWPGQAPMPPPDRSSMALDISGVIVVKAPTPERAKEIAAEDPGSESGDVHRRGRAVHGARRLVRQRGRRSASSRRCSSGFSSPDRTARRTPRPQSGCRPSTSPTWRARRTKASWCSPARSPPTARDAASSSIASPTRPRRGAAAKADPMIKAGRLALELHPWQVPIGALPVTGK